MLQLLKRDLERDNFKVQEVVDNLLLVEEFLSKDELESFLNIINSTEEQDWFYLYTAGLKTFCMEKFGHDDVESLVAEGKYEITQGWEDKNLDISHHEISQIITQRLGDLVKKIDNSLQLNSFSFQRMQSGVELKSHVDQQTDPSIQYAAILYLNDDYTDGEVFFKKKNIELRPKPGSLLVFPGNEEFEHGVRPVGEGKIRYVAPSFIKRTNFYENNKY